MKNYLIDSPQENDRLNYQNKIDVYSLSKEMRFISPHKDQHFLDAGCGNGNVTDALLQNGVTKLTGVDYSEDRIKEDTERFKNFSDVHFHTRSLDNTGFETNTFDRIVCRYIFEHVTNAKEILTELHRVLKVDGSIAIINFDNIFFDFYTKNESFNNSLSALKAKLPQDFEVGRKLPQYLSQIGFKNVQWEAEKLYFQGERLEMEIHNSRMRLEQARGHLGKYFDSLADYDSFAKTYLDEMKDPNNVLGWAKFLVKGTKSSTGKVLNLK